jgi:Protein of unknown function (DUF4240)
MTNTIRYPLHNLSPETLRDLQDKYPNASVQIELSEQPAEGGLSEEAFWALIALLDWSKTGDDEAVILPVVAKLAESPLRHIYDFKDILSQKLYLIDTREHARYIGEAAYNETSEQFSGDIFLFARCCAVANGQASYEQVRRDPAAMPKDLEFAPLLRIANEAYRRQKSALMRYVAAYPIETGSNLEGWGDHGNP